jgi:hypothetical protein
MNSRTDEVSPILPPDGSFLAEFQSDKIVGPVDTSEKEMLLTLLRFHFGPAQWWNAVDKEALGPLQFYFRPVQWWNAVVQDLGLGPAFTNAHPAADQIELYAIMADNSDRLPSYFLYEACRNLLLYVGPDSRPGGSKFTVINTLVLDGQRQPRESHRLHFGFLDSGTPEVSQGFDGSFLTDLRPSDIVGPPNPDEKEMLLTALRFYFGPAKWWKALTKDKVTQDDLNNADAILRKPGERYELLEQIPDLGRGYFAQAHQDTVPVKLYVVTNTQTNPGNPNRLPTYFLYEAHNNLTFYVGPDFLHNRPKITVINTYLLDGQHRPLESHTLDFGTMP